ncbi:MAG: three-Cys-motif partner protein TcmP [Acidobacteriia bacterium]|nr:three-Cys-motif partner protein TcmP [Terriglobia bacterium]
MVRPRKPLKFDEIGDWSELKLEILRKYAGAYTKIVTSKGLHPVYIDGFAGAGQHISEQTRELVPGSPLNALNVEPPFEEFHLVDLKEERVDNLRKLTSDKKNVYIYSGDSNELLVSEIFPKVRFEAYKRAICLLDPYGLHLDWRVLKSAAETKTIETFLNFPVMDMNMNVLFWRPENATEENIARMNAFWGDESWRAAAYKEEATLFGPQDEKQPNEAIVAAFRMRLKEVAGFKFVPDPAPMRNSRNAVVYYLFFAAQQQPADKIVSQILDRYRKQGKIRG